MIQPNLVHDYELGLGLVLGNYYLATSSWVMMILKPKASYKVMQIVRVTKYKYRRSRLGIHCYCLVTSFF